MSDPLQFDVRAPDKRRFLDALQHCDTGEVSYYEMEFSPRHVSAILGKKVAERSYLMPIEDYIEFARRVGMDMCPLSVPWWLGREPYTDEHGMVRYKEGSLRARADFTRITPPDFDWARRRIERFLNRRKGTQLGWTIGLPTAAGIIVSAMGYETFYTAVREDPELIDEFLDRIEPLALALTEAVLPYRPDAVCLPAFVSFKSGLIMSRELTERFVFARVAKHATVLKAAGVPVIIHSDGDNMDVMPRWIEMGCAAWHPVEPSERHTIYDYKERWGDRMTLCGNIDCASVLSQGAPAEVARDTLEHLERLSVGGGYICGSSHDVDDNVPLENLRAMAETVARYKRHEPDQQHQGAVRK
ncbi:MAG: hypothetical protein HY360_05895 [Verrucomicrobia bacterium]|nr:hypothetical protein [Verrucomicrobiota bacterium]